MTGFVRDVALGVATGLPMLVVVGPIALLLVDVGGATTDVYSALTPDAEEASLHREVVEVMWRGRTVEGDLGIRRSATGVADAALVPRDTLRGQVHHRHGVDDRDHLAALDHDRAGDVEPMDHLPGAQILLGDAADARPAGAFVGPSFNLSVELKNPADPDNPATVTVMGAQLSAWNYSLPEDDFVMENVDFRALWVKTDEKKAS